MPLEDFYAGDEGFHRFAQSFEAEWRQCADQPRLLAAAGGDLDIAMVLHHHFGERVFDALANKVPALENITPAECLKTESGRRRLKEYLWRMP